MFFIFNTNPRFPPFLLYVRCKSGVIFIRRSFRDALGIQAAHVRHILSWRLGHENISVAILPLSLIQEEQLSVTGERMCIKYW